MEKSFDPEKYEMTFCPLCQGDGKLAKTPEGFEVCKECGGFGLIKRRGNRVCALMNSTGSIKQRKLILLGY
jgi:DnaJ-class molecular chaperone